MLLRNLPDFRRLCKQCEGKQHLVDFADFEPNKKKKTSKLEQVRDIVAKQYEKEPRLRDRSAVHYFLLDHLHSEWHAEVYDVDFLRSFWPEHLHRAMSATFWPDDSAKAKYTWHRAVVQCPLHVHRNLMIYRWCCCRHG